jgi:hypothetical protein
VTLIASLRWCSCILPGPVMQQWYKRGLHAAIRRGSMPLQPSGNASQGGCCMQGGDRPRLMSRT